MKLVSNMGVIISILACLFGCSPFGYQPAHYERLADEITAKTAKQLKAQKGLLLIGTGGQMMHDVQMMMMGFNFYKVVDIEVARELLVDAVQSYLCDINSNEKIRPYLHDYPFTAQNVEIVIYFFTPNGHQVPSDQIMIAAATHGKMRYLVDNPENHALDTLYEETYEEALKLVSDKQSKSS